MEVTENRIKHCLAVGKKMKELAETCPDKYPVNPEEAFALGVLHDIGYEFSDQQEEHANKGGLFLKNQGYKYWREVFYHGIPQDEYQSEMLALLNYADMITGPDGGAMTIQQRIDDIGKRYGEDSRQKKEAVKLAKMLCVL